MMEFFSKIFNKDERGITLIELLVVIVILGIIAAVTIPMIIGAQENANENTNDRNVQILQDGVNRYYTDEDDTPASLDELVPAYISELPEVKGCESGGFDYDNQTGAVTVPSGCPSNK